MAEQESAAVRNANKQFRKEAQAREVALVWQEYAEKEAATRVKTAKLRAERLARDAAAQPAAPSRKRAAKTSSAKA